MRNVLWIIRGPDDVWWLFVLRYVLLFNNLSLQVKF